jgi:3',5'-cyclic AMP phosphodiesterase CpdA
MLDAGVKFYAALGNHDDPTQRFYKPFNMNGQRYYSWKAAKNVEFFALDSTFMDRTQQEWLDKALRGSSAAWKICFFHHPLYSSGMRHGSDLTLRTLLEPIFIKYKVSLVLSGHDHFYERVKSQSGIYYFVSGGAAKLRKGNVRNGTGITEAAFDRDNHFMLMAISGDNLVFRAVSRAKKVVDAGVIVRGHEAAGGTKVQTVTSGTGALH